MLQRIALAIFATAITATVSSAWAQDDGEVPYYIKTGDPSNPFTKDGQPLAAKRLKVFHVDRNTLQLTAADHVLDMGGMGMGAMGMGMSAGGGSGMGMGIKGGGGGLGSTGPGGMAGGAEGGMGYGGGGMMGGMAAPPSPSGVERVYAFVFDDEQVKGRTKIEVLTGVQSNHGMGMDGGMGMGSMGGEGSGEMGMGMEGMMGDGMGSRPIYVLGHLIPLEGIADFNAKRKQNNRALSPWTKETATLVANFVRLHVWKQDAIRDLKSSDRPPEQMVATEKLLRELLSEEYDGQLARQQLELTRLQQRLKNVENEIGRRRQAKERVVEVQLGKLVLESQGILDEGL